MMALLQGDWIFGIGQEHLRVRTSFGRLFHRFTSRPSPRCLLSLGGLFCLFGFVCLCFGLRRQLGRRFFEQSQ